MGVDIILVQNLEYARTILLRLEHESSTLKIQSRKQATQNQLLHQRALIKRLTDKLHNLDDEGISDCPSSAEEDLLGEDITAPTIPPPPIPPSLLHPKPAARTLPESTLRNRHQPSSPNPFLDRNSSPSSSTSPLLESDASTQAALTTSLVSLATALKSSSLAISHSIALDAEALSRATDGLDRNTSVMQAAGQKMGLLKRMTEGKGWWGRMILYAWIGGLWVVALVIVFVMPKLRF